MKENADPRAVAFGTALAVRLMDHIAHPGDRTWLGEAVAHAEGRDQPHSKQAVANWINGTNVPSPDRVFAIERALGVQPGALSQNLGYLPVDAVPIMTVLEALEFDPRLRAKMRSMLIGQYLAAID